MLERVFKNKTVIVLGHTGFKGSWLSIWLNDLGANVVGISDDIVSTPSNYVASSVPDFVEDYRIDISNRSKIAKLFVKTRPDFVFHLAAQSLVRPSYLNPSETMMVNAIGTVNVLESLRQLDKKCVAVMITSDKAYDNVEWVWGYRETDRLGGKDPYSASKGMAEFAIRSYVESFFKNNNLDIRIGIARAGNVIGGGDWAVDRIVPDCMRAWSCGSKVEIRNPNATRPWQHVLEPLSGYLTLAQNLSIKKDNHGCAYNFGPKTDQNYPVSVLIDKMSKYWSKIKWVDVSDKSHVHEATLLKLNCDKALSDLKWQSVLGFEDTVKNTVEWYKKYYDNSNQSMLDFTSDQINSYTNIAKLKKIPWACDD